MRTAADSGARHTTATVMRMIFRKKQEVPLYSKANPCMEKEPRQ
jgi:hypothetical protein